MKEINGIYCPKASLCSRVNHRRALVYMKQRGALESDLDERFRAIASECEKELPVYGAWKAFPIKRGHGAIEVCGAKLAFEGESIAKHLEDADFVVLMAFTLGMECERQLQRRQARSPLDGLMFDACTSSLVDSGADDFEEQVVRDLASIGFAKTGYRFSPGYGDFPLDIQPAFLDALEAGKNLGIFATKDNFLQPTKSITAVLGIRKAS